MLTRVTLLLFLSIHATAQDVGATWRQYATPDQAGYSEAALERARARARSIGSAAVMVIDRGHVVAAWGDVQRPFKCHSVRKSLLSALYGPYVDDGTIDLETTVAELALDDIAPLTEAEKQARIVDLLSARSGIYHRAAKEVPGTDDERPARGSHAPGTFFYYNNWDFNVLGVVFERLTGVGVFEAFERRIARPLGMQDYSLDEMSYELEPRRSRHPAHAFRLSARDAARFGWLFARGGDWNGESVVPASWVDASTTMHSDLGIGRGYGYMWWVYPAGSWGENSDSPALNGYDKFAAVGYGGHLVLVVPEAELVFVHRADTDNDRKVGGGDIWGLAEMVLAARVSAGEPEPDLVELAPVPLPGAVPRPARPRAVALDLETVRDYVGIYEVIPGLEVEVYLHEGRMFASLTGEGEGEFLAESATRYFLRNDPVQLEFFRDDDGEVTHLMIEAPDKTVSARRRR